MAKWSEIRRRVLLAQESIRTKRGTVRITDSTMLPAATTIAAAFLEVVPDRLRELHWQPNANEAQCYISGEARMTVVVADSTAGSFVYRPDDALFRRWLALTPYELVRACLKIGRSGRSSRRSRRR
jgi:oxalate decarboxylase/phosphoglucose isomerase-like protein (cupin superfamily)